MCPRNSLAQDRWVLRSWAIEAEIMGKLEVLWFKTTNYVIIVKCTALPGFLHTCSSRFNGFTCCRTRIPPTFSDMALIPSSWNAADSAPSCWVEPGSDIQLRTKLNIKKIMKNIMKPSSKKQIRIRHTCQVKTSKYALRQITWKGALSSE